LVASAAIVANAIIGQLHIHQPGLD